MASGTQFTARVSLLMIKAILVLFPFPTYGRPSERRLELLHVMPLQ